MDDAFVVRGRQGVGHLARNDQRLVERHLALRDSLRQRRTVDQLHDEKLRRLRALQAVERRDVRMIERGEELSFALEAGKPFGIGREGVRQDLQRDLAPELRIARAIHLAHPAGAER